MTRKFQVPNPLTGVSSDVDTIEEAIILRDQRIAEYMQQVNSMFTISVMIQHPELGFWIQAAADENGNPNTVDEFTLALFDMEASGEPFPTPDSMRQLNDSQN